MAIYSCIPQNLNMLNTPKLKLNIVVLDMQEDREVPIILGRPFLATGKAEISVHTGKLTLNIDDEKMVFNIFG